MSALDDEDKPEPFDALEALRDIMTHEKAMTSGPGVLTAKVKSAELLLEKATPATDKGAGYCKDAVAYLISVAEGNEQADLTTRVRAIQALIQHGFGGVS